MSAPFTIPTTVPSKVIVMSAPTANDDPVTWTVAPTEPHVGETAIAGGGAAAECQPVCAMNARLSRPREISLSLFVAAHHHRARLARPSQPDGLIRIDLDGRDAVIV